MWDASPRSVANRYGLIVAHAAIGIYALWLGWRLPANVLGDDAAITYRYVERAVGGHGLTYNDHEHVLGTSNPLYALGLAAFTWLGADVESAARVAGVVLFAMSAILAAVLSRRLAGSSVGLLAGVLLPTTYFFRYQALSGMESIFAVCLGLLATLALLDEREAWAGLFLGLAIWNKLDATLLALAVVAAWLLERRRLPVKMALVSGAVLVPWVLFSWWYYGSPVPHSFVAKVTQGRAQSMSHLWVAQFYHWERRWVIVIVAAATFALWKSWQPRQQLAAATLAGWFVIHFLALSFLNLGDYYPWYLTVLLPPPVILACALPGRLVQSRLPGRLALSCVALAALAWVGEFQVGLTYQDLASGNPVKSWEAFDNDRRLAGIFISQFSDPEGIVQSGFGWTAFEVANPFNDDSHLNSERLREPIAYLVSSGAPYQTGSVPPEMANGYVPVATFNLASDMFPGYSWFGVFAAPTSKIARLGPRLLQRRLFELPAPTPVSTQLSLQNVSIARLDMAADPPSGATFTIKTGGQPVTVVFSPSLSSDAARNHVVTFEVALADGAIAYQRRVAAGEELEPAAVRVSERASETATFSLITAPSDSTSGTPLARALWRNVKIIMGDAAIDLRRVRNPKLIDAWKHFNPPATVR